MKILPTLLATALLVCVSQAAFAKCAPREEFAEKLKQDYGEYVSLVGVREGGQSLIEFFISDGGTWTVIETFPDGRACSRAFGQNWMRVPKDEPGA